MNQTQGPQKLVASRPRRSIYILPNLFTTAALMAGFSAILFALDSKFDKAAIAIFVAMLMDALDGRIARWTNTQSAFGAEYDSLADVISFGLAPALIMYQWALRDLGSMQSFSGKLAWFATFFYIACAAIRLARFNVQIAVVDKRFFVGLPSPAAAALVVGFVWIGTHFGWADGRSIRWLALLVILYAATMMVSNVLFYSFKSVDFIKRVKFFVFVLFIILAGLFLTYPVQTLFLFFVMYSLSGPFHSYWRRCQRRIHLKKSSE